MEKALKIRGIPFTKKQIQLLTKGETVRQIQHPPPRKWEIASHYGNVEWMVDMIDWTTAPSSVKAQGEVKRTRKRAKGPETKKKEP